MPTNSGWIKLYRSLSDHGHLQMPDKALKLWIYLLLEVNHTPNARCASGEGWITYRRIRESCCDPAGPQWSDHTISKALDYLENGGYIRRIKTKVGAAQRLRVLNWHKYQGQSSADRAEVGAEVTAEVGAEVGAEARAEKQECQEDKECREGPRKKEEEEEAPAAPISSTSSEQPNWARWWESKSASFPPPPMLDAYEKFTAKGVTDELIIAVIQKAIGEKKRAPLAYAKGILSGLVASGVRTSAEWAEHEADQEHIERTRKLSPKKGFGALAEIMREMAGGEQNSGPRPKSTDDIDVTPGEEENIWAKRAKEQAERLRRQAENEDPHDRMRRERAETQARMTPTRPLDADHIE
jgi:hypothetical protein